MDRAYGEPLDIRAVAAVAHCSEAHFSRSFRAAFGETPHRYLQRRRVERSMFLLRETDRSITDICLDVEANIGYAAIGLAQQEHRALNAPTLQVAVRRLAKGGAEGTNEMGLRHDGDTSQ